MDYCFGSAVSVQVEPLEKVPDFAIIGGIHLPQLVDKYSVGLRVGTDAGARE